MSDVILDVKNLCKSYGSLEVLRDISTTFRKNEVVSIIGPSGGGKSTFLRCLNLLETPSSGSIYFEGTDLCGKGVNINLYRQKIGMVFQQFNLFENMNVMKNLTAGPVKIRKLGEAEAQEKALALLDKVGLADRAGAFPYQLSGGQKQRIAIARMLMQKSPIMVFDDSLSAVDAETDTKIRRALGAHQGTATVIFISHRVTTLMQADQILVLDDGKIADLGTHQELISRPGIYKEIYDIQMSSDDRKLVTQGGEQ